MRFFFRNDWRKIDKNREVNTPQNFCFGEWSEYTECKLSAEDAICGVGSKSRMRVCNVPEDCEATEKEEVECAIDCEGEWSDWGDYSGCSVTCGVGDMSRNRICPHGLTCIGNSTEIVECNLPACIYYQDWKDWQGNQNAHLWPDS